MRGRLLQAIRLAIGILSPHALGAANLTLLLGVFAVLAIQFLFLGTAFDLMPCDMLVALPGQLVIGLGPLMLAYLIVAAVTDLLALGPEA